MQTDEKTIRISTETLDQVKAVKPVEYKTGRFIDLLIRIGIKQFVGPVEEKEEPQSKPIRFQGDGL